MLNTIALVAALSSPLVDASGTYFCACAARCVTPHGEVLVAKSGLYPATSEANAITQCYAETLSQCLQGEGGVGFHPALARCY